MEGLSGFLREILSISVDIDRYDWGFFDVVVTLLQELLEFDIFDVFSQHSPLQSASWVC